MPWTTRCRKLVVLKGGRRIATLAEARDILLALPEAHQVRPHVIFAAQLLVAAAEAVERRGVASAGMQMARALTVEGLL
jgi:hypothetical protein